MNILDLTSFSKHFLCRLACTPKHLSDHFPNNHTTPSIPYSPTLPHHRLARNTYKLSGPFPHHPFQPHTPTPPTNSTHPKNNRWVKPKPFLYFKTLLLFKKASTWIPKDPKLRCMKISKLHWNKLFTFSLNINK